MDDGDDARPYPKPKRGHDYCPHACHWPDHCPPSCTKATVSSQATQLALLQKTQLKNVTTMQRILIALALAPAAAYVTPLWPRQLSKLSMQSDVSDLYSSVGVSTSAVDDRTMVAEDEVIELKTEEAAPIMVGEEAKAEEPAGTAPEAAKYKGVDGIENTRATLVGNASRDFGSLVFHRNKEQKHATLYTEMEKFFPGVCA